MNSGTPNKTRVNTIKGTIAKQAKNAATSKTNPGGPTIGGVQGVGVASTPKRPQHTQSTKSVRSQHTGPTRSGLGEAKESEATANRQLGQTARQKLIGAYYKPKHSTQGMNDYYAHNAKSTSMKKESIDEQIEPGDHIKIRDGKYMAGTRGQVIKSDGDHHQVQIGKSTVRTWLHKSEVQKAEPLKEALSHVVRFKDATKWKQHAEADGHHIEHDTDGTMSAHHPKHGEVGLFMKKENEGWLQKHISEEAPAMSVTNGAVAGVAPPDATVDYAAQKIRKVRKLAMAKRKSPKGE